jgi:hypothetical protein
MTISVKTPLLITLLFASAAALAQSVETGLRSDWNVVLRPEPSSTQPPATRVGNPPNEVVRRAAFKTKNGCWIIGYPFEGYREECTGDSFSLRATRPSHSQQAAEAAARRTTPNTSSVVYVSNSPSEGAVPSVTVPLR